MDTLHAPQCKSVIIASFTVLPVLTLFPCFSSTHNAGYRRPTLKYDIVVKHPGWICLVSRSYAHRPSQCHHLPLVSLQAEHHLQA